jgi:hypothetical protein
MTLEYLHSILHYNPDTGVFTWKVDRNSRVKVGSIAGTTDKDGYRIHIIDGKSYKAHRLAWLYMTGKPPSHIIDHKNLNPSDNSWKNLREATDSQSQANKRVGKNNKTGYKGVSYSSRDGVYIAHIRHNKKVIHLGTFRCPKAAYEVYCDHARKYHGEYARTQ